MKLKNFYTCGEPSRLSCVGYFPNRLKLLHFITINFYDKKKKKYNTFFLLKLHQEIWKWERFFRQTFKQSYFFHTEIHKND